jgi:hypothetical protein
MLARDAVGFEGSEREVDIERGTNREFARACVRPFHAPPPILSRLAAGCPSASRRRLSTARRVSRPDRAGFQQGIRQAVDCRRAGQGRCDAGAIPSRPTERDQHSLRSAGARLPGAAPNRLGYVATVKIIRGGEPSMYFRKTSDSRSRAPARVDAWAPDFPAPSSALAPFTCDAFQRAGENNLNRAEICESRLPTAWSRTGDSAPCVWTCRVRVPARAPT